MKGGGGGGGEGTPGKGSSPPPWNIFDLPLQRGEFAAANREMVKLQALILQKNGFNLKPFWQWRLLHEFFNITSKEHAV